MKLHFVTDGDGWVLDKAAERIAAHLPGSTIGRMPTQDADANIYFPYYRLKQPSGILDAALFTHREVGDNQFGAAGRQRWEAAAALADIKLVMNHAALDLLPDAVVVPLPADMRFAMQRDVRFGVVGRRYASGRKREQWIAELAMPGCKWLLTDGEVPDELMPRFYNEVDYVVVLSEVEGGPMCVKEAILSGRPVIAPNVGWAWEYPVIRYEGLDELKDIVKKLIPHDDSFAAARAINSAVFYATDKERLYA